MADAVRFLDNDDVAAMLEMDPLIEALETTYADMATGEAITGPKVETHAPSTQEGEFHRLKTMGGTVPRFGVQGLRIDSDLVRWPTVDGEVRREYVTADNRAELRVGAENGIVIAYDTESAEPRLIAPDGRMQRRRVGGTSALAAEYLAREDASTVGLLGNGWQAGGQLMALSRVRDLERVDVYSPTRQHREEFAAAFDDRIDAAVRAVGSAETAVSEKDIVDAATDSLTPIVDPDWLQPGVHVTCVNRYEVTREAVERADVAALHATEEIEGSSLFPEASSPPETGASDRWWRDEDADFWTDVRTLPDLCAGRDAGRSGPDEATLFVNNVGLGIQFAVCGHLLAEAAEGSDRGHEVPIGWFLQAVTG